MNTYSINARSFTQNYLKMLTNIQTNQLTSSKYVVFRKTPERSNKLFEHQTESSWMKNNSRNKVEYTSMSENLQMSMTNTVPNSPVTNPTPIKYREKPDSLEIIKVPSFKQFVLYTLEQILNCQGNEICLGNLNPHIAPIVSTCSPCVLQNDFIFKVTSNIFFLFSKC